MSVLNPGTTFLNGEQLTADLLNNLVSQATFTSASIDNQSTEISGASIIVKDEGIIQSKIAPGAVVFTKLAPALVIDDDTMATATATTLATSESIKAYVDSTVDSAPSIKAWCVFRPYSTGTNAPLAGSGVTSVKRVSSGVYEVNLSTAAPSSTYACFASGDSDDINQSSISIGAWSETTTKAKILVTNNVGNQVGTTENVSFSAIW